MATWIGIDGGGTGATAVALDDTGAILSRVTGGAALVDPLNPLAGASALASLARQALTEAGIKGRAEGLCCALAGAGREEVREVLTAELVRKSVARNIRVITDGEAALSDAVGGGAGVLLIAGTGSVAWARDGAGRTARAGGWGMLLGDEGSAYAIGIAALRAVVRAEDGREKKTILSERVLSTLSVNVPLDLIPWTAGATKKEIAALSRVVTKAADEKDVCARAILSTAAHDLAEQVRAVLGRTGPWSDHVSVSFAGGLIAPGQPLREPTWKALQSLPYGFLLRPDAVDAARGAAMMARQGG